MFLFRLPTARIPYSDEPEAGFRAQLRVYSKPHKVGNRIKAKKCWDSLYISLRIEAMGFPTFGLLLYMV